MMVQAILQAAAELFAEHGYARATTNKIARRAGVSVGSLYQYFPNKDSLLATLLEQHQADVGRILDNAIGRLADETDPLEKILRELLTDLVALHRQDPALTRALSTAVLHESDVVQASHRQESKTVRRLGQLLSARPDVRDGDPAVMAAVLGQATARLTRWLVHDAPSGLELSALLDETVLLLVRYLEK